MAQEARASVNRVGTLCCCLCVVVVAAIRCLFLLLQQVGRCNTKQSHLRPRDSH